MIRRKSGSAGSTCATFLSIAHDDGERVAFGLEAGRDDVAEILPVHLERQGDVALDLDEVDVVEIERMPASWSGPGP